jgi:hypothetical protein
VSTLYETEVVRRVFDNDEGHAITIGPSGDCPGHVMIYTEPQHEEYFGRIRLDLPAAMMRQIAQAMMAACAEAEIK